MYALFALTLVAALAHACGPALHLPPALEPFTVLLSVALPAWGTAVHGLNDLFDRDRIATRSQAMASALTQLATQAQQAPDHAALIAVVTRAEQMMALENFEWHVSMGFRSPAVA